MAEFGDFDIEVENSKESDVEMFVTEVVTAGIPVTITPTNARPIRALSLYPPRIGDNTGTNTINKYIKYSTDGGTTFHTLPVNEWISIPGVFDDVRIDASDDGMKCEIEVRS